MCSITKFIEQYPTDEACLEGIMKLRYGGTEFDCPKCHQHGRFYRMSRERAYVCQHCKFQLFPCVGTPMHRSRTSLQKWFIAMHLFSASKHGVAAKELERHLDVTYKTAWRIAHEIRKWMVEVDGEDPLDGDVEIDETLISGYQPGKRGRGTKGKTVVFCMLERDGEVMTKVVPNVRKKTLQPIVKDNARKSTTVHTDEPRSYSGLGKTGYEHKTVNHGTKEFVKGDSHVNGIEGFWSRLKLSIRGTHVPIPGKHLWKYAKEFEYRYNRRNQSGAIFRDMFAAL